MRAHLNFFTGFTVSFVSIFALSISQRLLIVVGGILGAGITYSHLGILKRTTRTLYIDFDQHQLFSIDEKGIKCIFPKDGRCGNNISSIHLMEFYTCRESVSRCKEPKKLLKYLRHMVELKLCTSCLKSSHKEKCVNKYVENWTAEVKYEVYNRKTPVSEETELVKTFDKSNGGEELCINKPPTQPVEEEQHLPGAYCDSPAPKLSPNAMPCSRQTQSGQRKATGTKDEPARIFTDTPAYSIPQEALPDPLSPSMQQHTPPEIPSPQQEMLPSSTSTMPTTPTRSNDGWQLVRYEVKKPETLHDRIFLPLQKKEVESGYMYILQRKDDEEYYKVGFTTTTVPNRLAGHNKKCQGIWQVVWDTKKLTKHAKRVEKLIHLECELRGTRYRENWCQTGGKCKGQHNEIIKATLKEVQKCVEHWWAG